MIEPDDLAKTREINFSPSHPDPTARALVFLNSISGVKAIGADDSHQVVVGYNLLENSLEELEAKLAAAGFILDDSLLSRLKRALVHHTEDVQRENLNISDRTQKNREIFVQVYQHHMHGDHDDTPEEWREYR